MKPPFRLIEQQVSRDTVTRLEQLLAHARNGRLIGLEFGAIYRERHYIVDTVGEARRNPTFALAVAGALWLKLALKVLHKR